jgi:putative DNA modification/repair radical SAM protein
MAAPTVPEKLAILADAAKYDASCASSGGQKRKAGPGGIGSVTGSGICHSYAPDGRCISLLKILLTNHCIYDCLYCVNRSSSNVARARFTPEEVADLTINFYKRNYIEGLFLSSGIIRSPDYTMEQLVRTARLLREQHGFRGYIHLKTIPEADPALVEQAGLYADRLSFNIELPRDGSFSQLAPQKNAVSIKRAMGGLRQTLDRAKHERKARHAPKFTATGQSTQMIVGADGAADSEILRASVGLYASYELKRVYYSAFSPIPDSSAGLPSRKAPLMREHRLYQADWLYRFYEFTVEDIEAATDNGMFDLSVDPKTAWALRHRERFPVDVNSAPRETLLRVPGLGVRSVDAILRNRRTGRLRIADVGKLARSLRSLRHFIVTDDWRPRGLETVDLRAQIEPKPRQMDLFG